MVDKEDKGTEDRIISFLSLAFIACVSTFFAVLIEIFFTNKLPK